MVLEYRGHYEEKDATLIPRIKHDMANKACRRAVKIGDPLSRPEMDSILKNMSKIDAPWACPHGRPSVIVTKPVKYEEPDAYRSNNILDHKFRGYIEDEDDNQYYNQLLASIKLMKGDLKYHKNIQADELLGTKDCRSILIE
jgi:hypothetical protein